MLRDSVKLSDSRGGAVARVESLDVRGPGEPLKSVTLSLGFGDVTPQTRLGQVLVTVEVIFGYVTLGLLISTLANRYLFSVP